MPLTFHYFGIATPCRTSLRVCRAKTECLACRFHDKWLEHIERQTAVLHNLFGFGIHAVGEIACKHSRQVQLPALVGVYGMHVVADIRCKRFKRFGRLRVATLDAERSVAKVDVAVFAERLQRVEHAVVAESAYRLDADTARRMGHYAFDKWHLRCNVGNVVVAYANEVDACVDGNV